MRIRRRSAGHTQQSLADAVDVSRQTIAAIERGRYAPSVFLALRVAKALNTTVEDLWEDDVSTVATQIDSPLPSY